MDGVDPRTANRAYLDSLCQKDVVSVDGVRRDPKKMMMLIRALARNESTVVKGTTLRRDMKEFDDEDIGSSTFDDYMQALERLNMVWSQPAFDPNLRSSVRVGKSPKRHLADPSLSFSALRMTVESAIKDVNTFGLMFEAMCERDLRVYSEADGGALFHYRDDRGNEADAIVELHDGRWGMFEIRLGQNQLEDAAANLLRISRMFEEKGGRTPCLLCVICGVCKYAYRREDGVYVVPITSLRERRLFPARLPGGPFTYPVLHGRRMTGILVDDIVEVRDPSEGGRLYTRGNYGYPRSGGGVDLDLVEATYLFECGRLEVESGGEKASFGELFMHSAAIYEDFDIRYLVYRDLRQRGFVVKSESGEFDLTVFPRGMTLSNSRPEYYVKAVSESAVFEIYDLISQVMDADSRGRKVLYGVADEEGDVTYYRMSLRDPSGKVFLSDSGIVPEGWLVRDRIFVYDLEDAEALRSGGFFGKTVGGFTQLSLTEGCFLLSRGRLSVFSPDGGPVPFEALRDFSSSVQEGFPARLKVYSDLRDRGMVVKSGFKYGNHFRVYTSSPDDCHARYLVHAIGDGVIRTWAEVSKTVRLSGGVKKEILFGKVVRKGVQYLEFQWFRP